MKPPEGGIRLGRVIDRDGIPWRLLVDVCRVLGIADASDVASRLDDDEKDTLDTVEGAKINGLGIIGAMPTIINESRLYKLILTSRKPAAKRFTKWVTRDLLPTLRRTGTYSMHQPEQRVLSADDRHVVGGIMKRVTLPGPAPFLHHSSGYVPKVDADRCPHPSRVIIVPRFRMMGETDTIFLGPSTWRWVKRQAVA